MTCSKVVTVSDLTYTNTKPTTPVSIRQLSRKIKKPDAKAVVCLVSSKYQQSKNCKRELCYCDIRNVPVFPVKVEENYEASDWLGLMTAGLLWFDIRDPERKQEAVNELIHLKNG